MFTLLNIDRNNLPKSHTVLVGNGRGRRRSPNTISEYSNNVYIYMCQSSRRSCSLYSLYDTVVFK